MTHVVQVDLTGRTALVTGGGSGIGRACALRLAAAGASVVVLDRSDSAGEVAKQIGGEAIVADLSDPETVAALQIQADILINNAGLQHVAPVERMPVERFTYLHSVMVEAPFRLIGKVLPHMYSRGWGRIVNISSVHGLRASAFKSAYVSAKHGLEGLSKVVALEGAEHGVTSNCVNPAYVRTPLVERVMLAPAAVKRLLEPDEVAEAVAYLCSPAAASVTGTSLVMDGGWSAH